MGLWVPAGPGSTEVRQMQQVGPNLYPSCSEVPQGEFQALRLPAALPAPPCSSAWDRIFGLVSITIIHPSGMKRLGEYA